MFSCSLYPADGDFLAEVDAEVGTMSPVFNTMPAWPYGAATMN